MFKRILSLVLLISFFSVGFCFAFDSSSIQSIWNDCLPKLTEWWNIALTWINNDAKPWIEEHLGADIRQEFEKEFNEALADVPTTLKAIWDKLVQVF
jgi:hypothetical protein